MRQYVKQTKTIFLGAVAIDSDALLYALWKVDHAIKITAIKIGVDATCTRANTNYNTFEVKNGSVVVAAIANGPDTSAGTTLTLGTFADMVVATAAGANILAADDTLSLKVTKTGNGLALAGAVLQIEYYDYNA
jgi:hypothetical protein